MVTIIASVIALLLGLNIGYWIHQKLVVKKANNKRNIKIFGKYYTITPRPDIDEL